MNNYFIFFDIIIKADENYWLDPSDLVISFFEILLLSWRPSETPRYQQGVLQIKLTAVKNFELLIEHCPLFGLHFASTGARRQLFKISYKSEIVSERETIESAKYSAFLWNFSAVKSSQFWHGQSSRLVNVCCIRSKEIRWECQYPTNFYCARPKCRIWIKKLGTWLRRILTAVNNEIPGQN